MLVFLNDREILCEVWAERTQFIFSVVVKRSWWEILCVDITSNLQAEISFLAYSVIIKRVLELADLSRSFNLKFWVCKFGRFFGLSWGWVCPVDSQYKQEITAWGKMLSRSLHSVGYNRAWCSDLPQEFGVRAREEATPVVLSLPEQIFKKKPVVWSKWGGKKKQPVP